MPERSSLNIPEITYSANTEFHVEINTWDMFGSRNLGKSMTANCFSANMFDMKNKMKW